MIVFRVEEENRRARAAARGFLILAASLALGAGAASAGELSGFSAADRSSAEAATRAYRDAWLSNRPAAVMATLTSDAVLLPSGMEPIRGEAAIRAFWFPSNRPATTVTAMEQTIEGVEGSGDVAVVHGRGSLTFSMKQDGREVVRSQRSTFLNVLRRQADGSWKIAIRMWSDLRR
jgi:ketosteroid isomerase-like protein